MKNLRNGLREKIYENKIAKKCLALLLALSMTAGFVMPYEDVFESAFTATAEEELVCGKEEHIHSEGCYQLICTENQEIQSETETAETDETTETSETSETAETAEADVEEHIHDENCYELACVLEEHIHDELCYAAEENNEQEEELNEDISGFSDFSFFDVFPETIAIMQSEFPPSKKPSVNKNGDPKPNKDKEYFESPANSVGSGSYEIKESNITSVSVTISGTTYNANGEKVEETVKIDGESADASFEFSYSISKKEHSITTDNPCIYYQLPEGVEVPTEYYGWTCYVTDPNYTSPSGDKIAGYYSINQDGLIVIQFIDDYVENVINKSDSFAGSLRFSGRLNRDNSQSGDRSVDMGDLSLKLDFPDKKSTVTKTHEKPVYSSDGVKISWTVKVTNVANPADIGGYVLKDSQSQFFNAANVKVTPSGVGSFNGNGEFVFTDNANTIPEITFTYTQVISEDEYIRLMQESPDWGDGQFKLTNNTAQLIDGDEIVSQVSKDVSAGKPTIVKSGEPSYQNGTFLENVIYWTIDVKAPEGSTLDGYFVEDAAFTDGLVTGSGTDENGHRKGIVITDSSGKELEAGKDYTISGNRIEFTGNFTSVKIKYATNKAATNGKVSNKAKIIYPNGKDGPEKETDVHYTGSRYNLNNKTGSYNHDTGILTWTIGADIPNKANKKNYLNGYLTLHDNALKDIEDLSKIKVTANWNNTVTDFETRVVGDTIEIFKGNDVYGILKRTEDKCGFTLIGGTAPDHYLHSISLTYETATDNSGLTVTESNGTTTYTNEVYDDNGNRSSHGVGVKDRSEIGKSVSAEAPNTAFWDKDALDKVLDWTVNLTEDAGFAINSEFTDTLTSSNTANKEDIKHYFEESSLNLSIVLRKKDGTTSTLKKEDGDFTITVTDNKLTIKFLKDFTAYTYATITYSSKATINKMGYDSADWESIRATFKNKAHYKGDADASYTYTSENPKYVKKFPLSLKKTWQDSDDLTGRPDYIYVRLMRKLPSQSDDEWKYIDQNENGEWVEVTVLDPDDVEDHAFAVSRSGGYYKYWSNLPKDTEDHNGDYEYKIVEIPVDGYTESYQDGYASFSSQSYEVINTKTNNINKYVLDKNGNRIKNGGRLPLDDIILDTLNETHVKQGETEWGQKTEIEVPITGKYYLVGYEIVPSIVDSGKYTVIDTLPEGWILSYTEGNSSYKYNPSVSGFGFSNFLTRSSYGYGDKYFDPLDSTKVIFGNIDKSITSIKYYLAIPEEKLKGMVESGITTVRNTAEFEDGDTSTAEVIISKEKTDYENPSLISKDVANTKVVNDPDAYNASGATIRYKILVNPNAQKLAPANKSTYDITDILHMPDGIKADIVSVTAKEVKLKPGAKLTDGKYSPDDVIDVTNDEPIVYSYVPGDDSVTETDLSDKFVFPSKPNILVQGSSSTDLNGYKTDSQTILKEGTTFKFTIKGNYVGLYDNGQPQYSEWDMMLYKYYSDGYSAGGGISANRIEKISDGKFEFVQTYTVTNDDLTKRKEDGTFAQLCDLAFQVSLGVFDIESIEVKAVERKVNNSGELVITVPDSKALLIEYEYRITKEGGFKNENNQGETIFITNEASLDTGSVSSWDKEEDTKFVVTDSSADVHANTKYIKLFKRDINDYNLKIGADFYIAYYDTENNKWIFCDSKELKTVDVNGTPVNYYELAFGSNAVAQGNEIPSGATVIDIDTSKDSTETLGNRNINIPEGINPSGKIFKVIEVPTEKGYEGTNIAKDKVQFKEWLSSYLENGTLPSGAESYKVFFDNYTAVHYFAYFDTSSSNGQNINTNNVPDGVDYDDIIKVANYEGVTVDNSKLVNITAEKQWNGGSFQENYAVTMKLYYSYSKVTNGSFPSTLYPVDAKTLGIPDSSFKSTVTLNQGQPSYTWKNLPTSLDGKRIYYYVREESYTTDGKTWYTLQPDGTYRSDAGKGTFSPSYEGNGISKAENGKDNAVVSVNNVSGLFFRKIWLDYYGNEMSSDVAELPDILKVKVLGTLKDGSTHELKIFQGTEEKTIEGGWLELEKSKSYMFKVTSDMTFKTADDESKTYKATDFTKFSLVEEETDYLTGTEEKIEGQYTGGYTQSSSVSIVKNGNAIVSITNQKKEATPIAITAEKSWVGGAPAGAKITLTLYKTTDTSITSENFKDHLDDMTEAGKIELPHENKWTYTWENLEQKVKGEDDVIRDYRYFIYEDTNGLKGYKPPVYTNQGRTGGGKITVTNSPVSKAQLEIVKHWSDENASDLPASITVDLYRKLKDQPTAQTASLTARGYRLSTAVANYNVDYEETGTLEFGSMTQDGVAILDDVVYTHTATGTDNDGKTYYQYDGWTTYSSWQTIKLKLPNMADGTLIEKAIINVQNTGWGAGNLSVTMGNNKQSIAIDKGDGNYTINLNNFVYNSDNSEISFACETFTITPITLYVAEAFSATIDPEEMFVGNEATITASEAITGFTILKGEGIVDCVLNKDEGIITVTGLEDGTATIEVKNGEGKTATVNITVHGIKLSSYEETRLASKRDDIKFTVEHTNGEAPTVKRKNSEGIYENVNITYKDGVVTIPYPEDILPDIETGVEVKYLVYYDNEKNSAEFTLNVNPQILTAEIVNGVTSVDVGDTFQVRVNKKTDKWELDPSLSLNSSPVQDKDGYWIYTITATGEKDVEGAKIVIGNPDGTDKIERSVNVKMVYKEAKVDTEGLEWLKEIVLTRNNDGKYVVTDPKTLAFLASLPVTADDGKTSYIYYIKEQTDNNKLNGYVPWKYVNNGSALKETGKTTMHIYNGKDKTESEGVELPSVGGIGTHPYTATGFAIMSASAVIMLIKRRKRRSL